MIGWIFIVIALPIVISWIIISSYALFFNEKSRPLPIQEETPFSPEAQPIEMKANNDKAILFIHGFPSSPATYRFTAQQAFDLGYDVYAPKLPGFATDPKLFVKTRFTDWYDYIFKFYSDLREQYPRLYVVGISMGGAITLKLSAETSGTAKAPQAVATMAAPIFLNKISKGIISQPMTPLLKPVAFFTKAINPELKYPTQADLDGIESWIGYHGIFPKQLHSLIQNLKIIRRQLPKITLPIYMLHDKNDKTVPCANMQAIANRISSNDIVTERLNLQRLKSNRHCLLLYRDIRVELFNRIDHFFCLHEGEGAQYIDKQMETYLSSLIKNDIISK